MLVRDIQDEGVDSAGAHITDVYARQPPHHAIYRTAQRVMVHFADDEQEAKRQSAVLAPLNPIRGEINGLIDGWRTSENPKAIARTKRYDRRIADALGVALDDDGPGSLTVLSGIKADLIEERTSWARFQYLIAAFATSIAIILLVWLITSTWFSSLQGGMSPNAWSLWFSLAGGTMGAFFSIAIAIRSRTVLPDLRWMDNAADAVLRVVIGAIAAAVLVSLVLLDAVNLTVGAVPLGVDSWLSILVVAFLAGFSERLIPDLLEKSAGFSAAPPQAGPRLQSRDNVAPAAAVPPQTAGTLSQIRGDLQATRQIVGALGSLGVGSAVLSRADGLAGSADQMLGAIDRVLQEGTSGPALGTVANDATKLLGQLDEVGLPGVLGGAASVLGSVMKVANPAIAGLAGGPVGVVAGLVIGGLQVVSDERKFNAWKTALLAKPFDRSLLPPSVDGNAALLALELSPLMSKRLEGLAPNVATELLRACITPGADGNPKSSIELAQDLLGAADPRGLRGRFASEAELSEALEEYRASAIFLRARDELAGQIAIPALPGSPATTIDLGTLLTGALKMREDPRAGEALEKIVYLVQALGGLHLDPGKLSSLVLDGLQVGAAMMGTSRTVEDPRNEAA